MWCGNRSDGGAPIAGGADADPGADAGADAGPIGDYLTFFSKIPQGRKDNPSTPPPPPPPPFPNDF